MTQQNTENDNPVNETTTFGKQLPNRGYAIVDVGDPTSAVVEHIKALEGKKVAVVMVGSAALGTTTFCADFAEKMLEEARTIDIPYTPAPLTEMPLEPANCHTGRQDRRARRKQQRKNKKRRKY